MKIRSSLSFSALAMFGALIAQLMVFPGSASAAAAYRVLITGDSITQGSSGDYTWRYRLWDKLGDTEPGNVEFVGTRSDLYDNVNDSFGSQYYAASFAGKAHAAKWGDAFTLELNNIASQVTNSGANTLVVMLGSNDLAYQTSPAATITNLRTYIERARAARPGLDVVVGEVVNKYDPWSQTYGLTSQVNDYAARLDGVASSMNTSSERVVIASTRSGWDARIHTWDGTHPNPTGEALIAQRVSEGLSAIGIGSSSPNIASDKSWNVVGPGVGLQSGSEQATLSWSRTSTGATGMLIETKLATINEAWHRLPYAVGGSGWTAGVLAAGGTYDFRIVPSKGWNTGLAGPASRVVAGGPTPAAISSVSVSPGGDSIYGGKQAAVNWGVSTNATGYLLSSRLMSNGTLVWDDLPYPVDVSTRQWVWQPLAPGRRYQMRIQGVRGFLDSAWKSSSTARMKGLPGDRAYAAIGDSYSSGLGSDRGYSNEQCMQATHSWATLMQPLFQSSDRVFACAGDTISGVRGQMTEMNTWFSGRRGKPQLITLTVGGNDVGFVSALTKCALDACTGDESRIWGNIDAVESSLRLLYDDIQRAQPYADIVVGGYPWVVEPNGGSNNPLCWDSAIGENETEMITRLSTHMNSTIASAAHSAGVWTVGQSVRSMFVGHNACTGGIHEWIHAGNLDFGGVKLVIDKKSFHPNDSGQNAYALAFSNTLIALSQ